MTTINIYISHCIFKKIIKHYHKQSTFLKKKVLQKTLYNIHICILYNLKQQYTFLKKSMIKNIICFIRID